MKDLTSNYSILAEPSMSLLKVHQLHSLLVNTEDLKEIEINECDDVYNKLKDLTRKHSKLSKNDFEEWVKMEASTDKNVADKLLSG